MASLRRNIGVTVGFASLLFAPGCKQLLGLHERDENVDAGVEDGEGSAMSDARSDVKTTPARGTCGALDHPSQACADCMDRNCCTEADACHKDPACNLEADCLFQCGDDGACRARCAQFYNRSPALLAETVCREKSCASECQLSCGGFGYSAATGCDTCVRSNCCQVSAACAKNADCLALDLCRSNCLPGSISCPPQCDATYPLGAGDYQAWTSCVQNENTCGPICQGGHNWQCLGTSISWPRPKGAGNLTFSVAIADLLSERPYAGSLVKACNKLDAQCALPIDQSTTDSDGLVSLTVPAGSDGFSGYLDITGGDNGSVDGGTSPIFPALWYPVPPIVSPGLRQRIQFVSAADLPTLGALTRAEIDPTRGHFAANALDCNLIAAGGVSFTADVADDKTRSFYFVGGVPNISATSTDPQTAIGGFVNLPGNQLALITATATQDGNKKIGSLVFHIRPGSFTTTSLPPVP